MKKVSLYFAFLVVVLSCFDALAQIPEGSTDSLGVVTEEIRIPPSRGSLAFGGSLGYSSAVPDAGDAVSTLVLGVNAHLFIVRSLSIGAEITSTNISSGSTSLTMIEIGPKIRVMFGGQQSRTFPYIHFAYNSLSSNFSYGWGSHEETGSSFRAGAGFLFRRWTHVGMSLEFGLDFQNFEHTNSTSFGVTFGASGLLYGLF